MAEKRMFTQKIIDSDPFLDMPLSTQALYFHLNMRADDDGFINNPKRIQRTIGASEDDLKLLLAKRFVIGFENGVIVIKHWRMHNTLRKDRYNPTQYQDEFSRLEVKENNAYTEKSIEVTVIPSLPEPVIESVATTWQPTGNQLATQYREDKNSIDKNSKEKVSLIDSDESVSCQQIVDLYNSICKSFPSVRSLSEARKKAIKARLKTYSLDDFKTVFENAEASSFLKGGNDRNWSANFDWLIADKNMIKVLEGNYVDKPKRGRKEPVPGWIGFQMGEAEKESVMRVMNEDIDEEELKRLEAEQEKELAERAARLKKMLRE